MKKIITVTLSLAACLLFTSSGFADYESKVARELASSVKKDLNKTYGNFPIKVDDEISLTNISSKGRTIIYDYRYKAKSVKFSQKDVDSFSELLFDEELCQNEELVSFFKEKDIEWVNRFTFKDKKTMSSSYHIKDICDKISTNDF